MTMSEFLERGQPLLICCVVVHGHELFKRNAM